MSSGSDSRSVEWRGGIRIGGGGAETRSDWPHRLRQERHGKHHLRTMSLPVRAEGGFGDLRVRMRSNGRRVLRDDEERPRRGHARRRSFFVIFLKNFRSLMKSV